MYGGFYGFETSRNQRDFIYNKAVLSGNIENQNSVIDESYHGIYFDSTLGLISL